MSTFGMCIVVLDPHWVNLLQPFSTIPPCAHTWQTCYSDRRMDKRFCLRNFWARLTHPATSCDSLPLVSMFMA